MVKVFGAKIGQTDTEIILDCLVTNYGSGN